MIEKSNGSPRAMRLTGRDERLRSREARAEWLARFERSGLSLAAFCREQQLPYWTLRYWLRRARQTGSPGGKLVEVSTEAIGAMPAAIAASGLGTAITIRLPNRIELEVAGGSDARWVGSLIREALACSG